LQAELNELRTQVSSQFPASTAPAAVAPFQLAGVRSISHDQFQSWELNEQLRQQSQQFSSLVPPPPQMMQL